jgi:selenocysteine-specific elongation factor
VLDAHPRRHGRGPSAVRLRLIQEGNVDQLTAIGDANQSTEAESGRVAAAPEPTDAVPAQPSRLALQVLSILREDGALPRGIQALAATLAVDRAEVIRALGALAGAGDIVRVNPDVYYPTAELEALRERIVTLIRSRDAISVAELRDALGISRKYSQALLAYLDADKVTLRQGDRRVLRRPHAFDRGR